MYMYIYEYMLGGRLASTQVGGEAAGQPSMRASGRHARRRAGGWVGGSVVWQMGRRLFELTLGFVG